jgi:hypothetical protein
MKRCLAVLAILFFSIPVSAQDPEPERPPCPQELLDSGGICLTKEQKEKLVEAVKELEDIHESKAEVELEEPIIIIRDWEDRVYINGGEKKPIKMKLKVGEHVDRDMEVQLPIRVYYREEPPDPWFRLRIRFQAGILVPEAIRSIRNATEDDENDGLEEFWDAGLSWDFLHYDALNLAIYTGIRSVGIGPGVDLTKNFGLYAGYSFVYTSLGHSLQTAAYFSFN